MRCDFPGCLQKAQYLIGSLQREIDGLPKWLHMCDEHETQIAKENGVIVHEAKDLGMTVMDFVNKRQRQRMVAKGGKYANRRC